MTNPRTFLGPCSAILLATALCAQEPLVEPPSPPPLPARVDLRPEFDRLGIGPRSQGRRPTCSVFTVVSTLELPLAKLRGAGLRLSPEFANRAKNLTTGQRRDGGFFHDILAGLAAQGIVAEAAFPYAEQFDPDAVPTAAAEAVAAEAQALRTLIARRLRVVWIKPWSNTSKGLDAAQFDAVRRVLASGLPVATGMAHSRTLVGYRDDPAMPGGGVFLTLDSGPGRYAEVSYEFVRTELFDVFWFEILPEPERPAERKSGGTRGSGDGTAGGGALPFPA